ncbi:hypothetical protein GCM10007231_03370 [Nocardioides daphniae]|uniref:Uncharacterized protein n=1 Tax=Nocardioides daphniae TaxID=402297 RepID=A0ABQ1PYX3_9ACTN|nr:hypothetical protein GCM10007231_03370 [Nocardioides daphniae]
MPVEPVEVDAELGHSEPLLAAAQGNAGGDGRLVDGDRHGTPCGFGAEVTGARIVAQEASSRA